MIPKTIKIIYWSVTGLFILAMLLDEIAGVLRVKGGKEALAHLGYPMYFLTILRTAKILGAIAILQTKFQTIKEWAYAGFTFKFISVFARPPLSATESAADSADFVLAVMVVSYFLSKQLN